MRFGKGVPVADGFCFVARKSVVRDTFSRFDQLSCHFGNLYSEFRWDSRCFERPVLDGDVIASISFSRARTAIMQFYPIRSVLYPEAARDVFVDEVLPHMHAWLEGQITKPDTAVLGYEELVITWNGSTHGLKTVKFL